jgi:4-amino-4-deoxy-L-arabinose transferase-like glycosyltransferase
MEMKIKLLILITLLGGLLRFYHLSSNPPGLYVDEISFGYNAYSVLKTARDEYGTLMPLAFRSFNDFKAPLYVYLLVPTIALFGLNEFAVRFPAALLGTLTIPLIYFLVLQIFKNKKIALLAAISLAISPWHLQFSRAGFEANTMVFFELLGLTLFLYSNSRFKYYIAAAVSFGLAFNAYHGARVWIPIFLSTIAIFHFKDLPKQKSKALLLAISLSIFFLPAILNFKDVTARGRDVLILGQKNVQKTFVSNYISHFSPTFLFISGDSIGRHSVPGMGELYMFQIPFVTLGLLMLIKKKEQNFKFLIAWLLVSPIPSAIATPAPHALRDLSSATVWSILTAAGIYTFLKTKMNKLQKVTLYIIISIVALYSIITYLHLYHSHYLKEKAIDWSAGAKEMVQYVEGVQGDYDRIFITKNYSIPYIYFLFYTKYDPKKYQQDHGDHNHFGKYYFNTIDWPSYKGSYLIVDDGGSHPTNLKKEIYINENNLIYRIGN